MATSFSAGLRNGMLATDSFVGTLANPVMRIYSGDVPADAGAGIGSATLLVTITNDDQGAGYPLAFDATATNGVLPKDPAQTWSGTAAASGTASFFRIVSESDADDADASAPRIQGQVGTAGSDLNLSTVAVAAGEARTVNSFNVVLPTLV